MSLWVVSKRLKKDYLVKKIIACWRIKNSDKEYEHVLKVWDRFEMKTMKDYHNLYLKYDVSLFGDVFEKI